LTQGAATVPAKERYVKFIRSIVKMALFAGFALALGGCVVRPLGWGHGGHGGHGAHGSSARGHADSDRGHSQGNDYRRDNRNRSGH
jgi:hypothetical protein